ncbi:MAG: protein kinase [Planctomycetes bacterium]|nr:protein kinase [Planctomycetota bacterium]
MPEVACPSCQARIQSGKRYCPSCGARQPSAEAAPSPPPAGATALAGADAAGTLAPGLSTALWKSDPGAESPLSAEPARPPASAAAAGSGDELIPPDSVIDGKYRVVERLGAGGFGSVYRVKHSLLDRSFALKTLHATLVADPQVRERFFREARVLMDLVHPNVVPVREVGEWQGQLYLVMDLCPGEPLAAWIERRRRFPAEAAANLALQVLPALDYAHGKGIVHRDLKPANLLVDFDSEGRWAIKIVDFGVAKVVNQEEASTEDSPLTGAGALLGTPAYMSPEQAQGIAVDGRADLYSLAVILYEMTVGRRPIQANNILQFLSRILQDPPPPFAEAGVQDELPGFEALVLRTLAKDPKDRPATAREMLREVEGILQRARRGSQAGLVGLAGVAAGSADANAVAALAPMHAHARPPANPVAHPAGHGAPPAPAVHARPVAPAAPASPPAPPTPSAPASPARRLSSPALPALRSPAGPPAASADAERSGRVPVPSSPSPRPAAPRPAPRVESAPSPLRKTAAPRGAALAADASAWQSFRTPALVGAAVLAGLVWWLASGPSEVGGGKPPVRSGGSPDPPPDPVPDGDAAAEAARLESARKEFARVKAKADAAIPSGELLAEEHPFREATQQLRVFAEITCADIQAVAAEARAYLADLERRESAAVKAAHDKALVEARERRKAGSASAALASVKRALAFLPQSEEARRAGEELQVGVAKELLAAVRDRAKSAIPIGELPAEEHPHKEAIRIVRVFAESADAALVRADARELVRAMEEREGREVRTALDAALVEARRKLAAKDWAAAAAALRRALALRPKSDEAKDLNAQLQAARGPGGR